MIHILVSLFPSIITTRLSYYTNVSFSVIFVCGLPGTSGDGPDKPVGYYYYDAHVYTFFCYIHPSLAGKSPFAG